MYKQLSILLLFIGALLPKNSTAQSSGPLTASVNCSNNTINVSNVPPSSSSTPLYTVGAFNSTNPCKRIFIGYTYPCSEGLQTHFYLDQYNWATGTWSQVGGTTFCPQFTNVPHGTYRVRAENPIEANGSGCAEGHIKIYDTSGKFLGYLGTYTNAPQYTSNTVVVGATLQSEVVAHYLETYGNLTNGWFNFDETPKLNTTGCINYDRYWVAIYEHGGLNRSLGGWNFGAIPNNQINLYQLWNNNFHTGFEPITTGINYEVQFALAGPCNTVWVQAPLSNFAVCTQGMTCRGVLDEQSITLSPNPTNGNFHLDNIEPTRFESDFHLSLYNLSGQKVKEFNQYEESFDVADLTNGLYMVNLQGGGIRSKTFKLSIVK